MDPSENRRHGAAFCQFLNLKYGKKGTRSKTGTFQIEYVLPTLLPACLIHRNPALVLRVTHLLTSPGSLGNWDEPSLKQCRDSDFRVKKSPDGKSWLQPSSAVCVVQNRTRGGCKAPKYIKQKGIPVLDASAVLFLGDDDHPRLAFHFGDHLRVMYTVSVLCYL